MGVLMPAQSLGMVTANTYYAALRVPGDILAWMCSPSGPIGKKAARANIALPERDEVSNLPPITAHLNRGRWLIACPECVRDFQLAFDPEGLFLCTACWNHYAGGMWRRTVILAKHRDELETALRSKSKDEQSWIDGIGIVTEETSMAVYQEAIRG